MNDVTKTEHDVNDKLKHALIMGDLSKLNPREKVDYYNKTCMSLGLNPLTKPFAYIRLQGKETLYATKNATDQLRRIYGVSITDCTQELKGDLLIVTAKATDKFGKVDTDVGVLPVGSLKGDSLANAIMKTVTKAKRRVTLSICGLGMFDDSEMDTMSEEDAQKITLNGQPALDDKYVDVSSWPENLRDIHTDSPILKTDFFNGPDFLVPTGKYRGMRLKEIELDELTVFFNKYMQSAFEKTNGSFFCPLKQRTYEAVSDYIDNFETYEDIIGEQDAE